MPSFDIHYSLFYKLHKPGSLFRLDWPLFRPAAALTPEAFYRQLILQLAVEILSECLKFIRHDRFPYLFHKTDKMMNVMDRV